VGWQERHRGNQRALSPLKKVQTETECGDGSFDWKAAEYTFTLMKHYFNHGVNLYTYWNMVLDGGV